MLNINLLQERGDKVSVSPKPKRSWRIAWLMGFLVLATGLALRFLPEAQSLFDRVDRRLQDGLIALLDLPQHPPVPVTLVEMEDAANWTALEYSLFLKALPPATGKNPPVILFTSMPPVGQTAYDRAYQQLAIRQPRLVLPVRVTVGGQDDESVAWWLKGWVADPSEMELPASGPLVNSVPEMLRGTVASGISNPPTEAGSARLYYLVGRKNVPSLALRGAMLARKVSDENMRFDHGLILGDQRFPAQRNGSFQVDFSFLPGMPRIASSDLLLNLANIDPAAASEAKITNDQLQGVLVLGDLSPTARIVPVGNGTLVTQAEWVAATVATLCNGPLLVKAPGWIQLAVLAVCSFWPLFFWRCRGEGKWLGFLFLTICCLALNHYLAAEWSLAGPFCLPVILLFTSTALHHLASLLPIKKYESD